MPKKGKHGKPMTKTRYIPKMFLRGDSVIYILKNPNWLIYNESICAIIE